MPNLARLILPSPKDKIIVALDVNELTKVEELVRELSPHVGCFKVGLELLTTFGARTIVSLIHSLGGKVFYDGKFHDISDTVRAAGDAACNLGVKMFNVHCLGGTKALKNAKEAARHSIAQPIVLGVTILTSLKYEDLVIMGIAEKLNIADPDELAILEQRRMEQLVTNLALMAQDAGLDGVIASPKEIKVIREHCDDGFLIVTPGIRPEWAPANDQKRIMTPGKAVALGADYLVIGRPITNPPKEIGGPMEAIKLITAEIEAALKAKGA